VNQIPALRDRPEDLGHLIGTMLERHRGSRPPLRIRPDAARALFAHDWPLNVRELEQCLAAAIVLTEDDVIGLEHLPASIRDGSAHTTRPARDAPGPPPDLSPEDAAIRAELVAALAETAGNVSEAARRMSKARQQVQRWIRRFAIDREEFTRRDR